LSAERRDTFDSVRNLKDAIRGFIDGGNDRCEPFTWPKAPRPSSPKPIVNKPQPRVI